jgi:hypothetical protein
MEKISLHIPDERQFENVFNSRLFKTIHVDIIKNKKVG